MSDLPASDDQPSDHQHSAGGVVVHDGQVLLIEPAPGRWQLPKGHLEAGETAAAAAAREVQEETGVRAEVLGPLPSIDYWYSAGRSRRIYKIVDYFLMAYVEGDPRDHDPHEVEQARWMPWDEALATLTFDNEREVLAEARRRQHRSGA